MKKLLVILALLLATTAQAEERDIRTSLLDMFRAQVADLTDFDDELCGLSGTYYLVSTNGVWSCETGVTVTEVLLGSGTAADPSIAPASETNTGFYFPVAGAQIGVTLQGTARYIFTATYLQSSEPIRFGNVSGTTEPQVAFLSDPDTGFYFDNLVPGELQFVSGGAGIMSFNAGGLTLDCATCEIHVGYDDDATHAGNPQYAFADDGSGNPPQSGLGYNYAVGGNYVNLSVNGTLVQFWTSSYFAAYKPLRLYTATAAAPGLTFQHDTNTGIYSTNGVTPSGTIMFTSDSADAGSISAAGITTEGQFFSNAALATPATPHYAFTADTDTGLYLHAAGNMRAAAASTIINTWQNSGLYLLKPIFFGYGITGADNPGATAPAFSFYPDTNTGIYQIDGVLGDDSIAFATGGVRAGYFDASQRFFTDGQLVLSPGTAASPGLTFTSGGAYGYGIYSASTGTINFTGTGPTNDMSVSGSAITVYRDLRVESGGTAADPSIQMSGDTDTGIYPYAAGALGFATDGTVGMYLSGSDLTVVGQVNAATFGDASFEGEMDFGTACTFGAADTTPNPAGCTYWKTGGAVTITNFDGGTYSTGQTFIIEVAHNIVISSCGVNFWCGDSANVDDIRLRTGDYAQFTYRSDGYWALQWETSQINAFKSQTLVFLGSEIAATNDVGMVWLPVNGYQSTLTGFSCVASGGSTANLDVYIEDCASNLSSCGATGAALTITTNDSANTDYVIATDDINTSGRWWKFNFGTVTTAPDKLTCAIEYITY